MIGLPTNSFRVKVIIFIICLREKSVMKTGQLLNHVLLINLAL